MLMYCDLLLKKSKIEYLVDQSQYAKEHPKSGYTFHVSALNQMRAAKRDPIIILQTFTLSKQAEIELTIQSLKPDNFDFYLKQITNFEK